MPAGKSKLETIRKLFIFFKIYIKAVADTLKDEGATRAAALAFYAFFSLCPLFLIFFSVLGFVFNSTDLETNAQRFLSELFPGSKGFIERSIAHTVELRRSTGIIGGAILLWTAIYFFTALEEAINKAWKVSSERHFIRKKFLSILVMFFVGIVLLVSVSFMSFIYLIYSHALAILPEWMNKLFLLRRLIYPLITLSSAAILFGSFYRFLPNREVKLSDIIPGTVITTAIWGIILYIFTLYLNSYSEYATIFGSVGTLIGLLTWIYISCLVVIIGAEFTYEYKRTRESQFTTKRILEKKSR